MWFAYGFQFVYILLMYRIVIQFISTVQLHPRYLFLIDITSEPLQDFSSQHIAVIYSRNQSIGIWKVYVVLLITE